MFWRDCASKRDGNTPFKAALKVKCLGASCIGDGFLLHMENQNIVKTVHPFLPQSKLQWSNSAHAKKISKKK